MDKQGNQYKNSPIQEVVCEFRFELEHNFGQAEINAFFDNIKEKFPTTKKGEFHEMQLKVDTKEKKEELSNNSHQFDQFFSIDGKSLVQLDKNKISVHRLKPYVSWKEFYPLIELALEAYLINAKTKLIQRIGLRYINIIGINSSFEVEEYFNLRPSISDKMPQTLSNFNVGAIFIMGNGIDSAKVQLANQWLAPEKSQVMLDIDYYLTKPETIKKEDISGWLKNAHCNIENMFESALTDKAKALFN